MTDYDDLVAQATFPSPPPASPQPPPQQAFAPQSAPPPVAPPKPAVATPAPTPVAAPQPAQTAVPPPNPLQQLGIPDLSDKIAKARADGHSDDEIRSYIAQSKTFGPKFQEAQKMGIEPDQIFQQIGLGAPPKQQQQGSQAAGNSPYNTAALLRYPAEVRPLIQLAGENRLGRTLNPENQYDRGLLQAAIEYNPNLDLSKSNSAGGREAVYFNRTTAAGSEGVTALKNIVELPLNTSTGIFGSRTTQGGGLLNAGKESLTNTLTSQGVQEYNTMIAGVSRNLSTIESSGLAPPGSLTHSFDSVTLKEGDTPLTQLRKLAETRQIIEKGLEPTLINPRIPQQQRDYVQAIIKQAQDAVPFTHHDITTFEREGKPYQSLSDFAASKNLANKPQPSGSQASQSQSAAPQMPRVNSPEEAYKLPKGTHFLDPNGVMRVVP